MLHALPACLDSTAAPAAADDELDMEAQRVASMLESTLGGTLITGTPPSLQPMTSRRTRPTTLSAPSSPVST